MGKADVPLYPGQVPGAGGVLDLRHGFQQLHIAAKAGAPLLDEPGGVYQALDGLGEVADIQQEHHQLRKGQRPLEDGEPAEHHHRNGDEAGKGVHAAPAEGLAPVAGPAALEEFFVEAVELGCLDLLVAEGLHHADGGEGVLRLGVDLPHILPALPQGAGHLLVEIEGIGQHKGQKGQDDQSHPPVDVPQDEAGSQKLDGVYQDVLGDMVEKLRQGEGIVGQAAHQVPDGVGVKIGEGQALVVAEELSPHVPLHFGADGVALIVHKIAAQRLDEHQCQQQGPHPQDFPRRAAQIPGEDVFCDVPRPQGQNQPDGRSSEGAQQVGGEQPLIGLVE